MSGAIPVLAYHRVAAGERMTPEIFGGHLALLARCGLPSLLPAELGTASRGFLLTFDDGFADLWTHLRDTLARHGVRAAVFAIPSRAGEGPPRPAGGPPPFAGIEAQAHARAAAGGPDDAFLRWSELAALEATGLVAVQSHSWSHRAGWVSDRVRGFNGVGLQGHWTLGQASGGDERLGVPLFRRGSALAHRLFLPDPGQAARCAEWVAARGGARFVAERGSRRVTLDLEALLRTDGGVRGRWESDGEREARTLEEIVRAREALERRLGGRRDELCLPWGEYDAVTLACARRAGIGRVYTLRRRPNPAGRIGLLVHRFEPRPRRAAWLRRRLRVFSSVALATVAGLLSGRA